MSDRQWPATILGTAWLTYDPDDGWTEHDNPHDAERTFGAIVDHLRDGASDGWHESADSAAWGVWIPIERLRLHAKAWPEDDTEDGERCRDAGWDAILEGVVERVEADSAALDFCVRRESAAFAALRAERDEARAEADALRADLDVARATIALIAEACAADGCEDLAATLTPSDYGDLVEHVAVVVSEGHALRAEVARLQTNPLAKMLHRIPATEAPFELIYHPSDVGDPGWTCAVAGCVDYGTLDAVIAAACDRLGVDHG